MAKLFKLLVGVFAIVGVLATAGIGLAYATHTELVHQFLDVKDDFRAVPEQRRNEVFAELPARITFEREIQEDMQALPESRQAELYGQLTRSRDAVFEQFKKRIAAEAKIVRAAEPAKQAAAEVSKTIEATLGKVDVGFDLTGGFKAPATSKLSDVRQARAELSAARLAYGEALHAGNDRVPAAVNVLDALDRLGDEIQEARGASLSNAEQRELSEIVTDAKATLYDMKQTPGLSGDARAQALLREVPPKLGQ